ncbi:helix-turn-helix domain-containing protein [Desulfomonile tiedjei]|uniref:helix-turn-helix domain-containing protein n=1 Tax=Desulfomonile tiedjei TaxID=2358 RepID=UPI00059E6F25|nr:transcriptional regulator [Desulfomonile tiedjei]
MKVPLTRLECLRRLAGLSQKELAQKINYGSTTPISLVERERKTSQRVVTGKFKKLLEQFFDVPFPKLAEKLDLSKLLTQ